MSNRQLRLEVESALQTEWAGFQKRHPRLAGVLDQELLVEQAVAALDEDEEYQQAMADAQAEGLAAEVLGGVVLRYVQKWLRHIVG